MARGPRIACLAVDNFVLAALYRAEPELCGQAVAVTEGRGARAPVVAVSPEAEQAGVSMGMSSAQALAVLSTLIIRPLCEEHLRATEGALVDVAWSFSPSVENAGRGLIFLEVAGSTAMYENERQLAAALAYRSKRVGLGVRVGIGSSKIVARLAARAAEAVIVPEGEEVRFMAPLPVNLLQGSDKVFLTLSRWGIKRIRQLVSLPRDQVVVRLGKEGWDLMRQARGEDLRPLSPIPRRDEFCEAVELEYAVDSSEPLLFILRGMLDRLLARLAVRAMVPGALKLSLGLAGVVKGRMEEHAIGLVAPTGEAKVLLTILRRNLEQKPPASPVECVRLSAQPTRPRPTELDLFSPAGPAPRELAGTVARLVAACGEKRVGSPAVMDSYNPDRFKLLSFAPAEGGGGGEVNQLPGGFGRLVLRAIRPASAVEVLSVCGCPGFVRGPAIGGRVINIAGPWGVEGEWWAG